MFLKICRSLYFQPQISIYCNFKQTCFYAQSVKLKEGNEVYDKWLHPETPVYMTYYIFNVTNPESVSKGGIPNVQEFGPYTYRY